MGEVCSYCVGNPHIMICQNQGNQCVYMVNQLFNLRFPLTFSTDVTAKPAGIGCCDPVNTCSLSGVNRNLKKQVFRRKRNKKCKRWLIAVFILLLVSTLPVIKKYTMEKKS